MRRPPFQVNPLALSVALILTVPMPVLAQDVFTSPFNNSTTITEQVVVPAPTGTITVNNATTDVQITSTISGVGGLVKKGVGTLTLTADNAYVGGTNIQEGTLAISGDKSLGSTDKTLGVNTGNVAISNGATLKTNSDVTVSTDRVLTITGSATGETIDTAGHNSEINGQITGTGKLIKKGDGSLTVSNQTLITANTPNNYTGGTLIDGGTLIIDKDSDLGAVSGTLEIKSGALQVNNNTDIQRKVTTTSISGGGINTSGNDVILSGHVAGDGPLVKLGAGTLTLKDATNTQSETAVLGGKVSIANNRALGTASGKLTLDGGTLQTTASLVIEDKAAAGRDIHIGDGGGTFETVGSNNNLEIKGSIVKAGSGLSTSTGEIGTGGGTGVGTGGLTKTGAGTLTLSGTNTYGGSTTVQGGKLVVNNLKNIGDATAKLILDGGNIKFTGAVTLSSLTLNGEGGTFDTSANSSTVSAVTGSGGLRKAGNGTLNVTGANTYTGDTTISEGKLQITSDAALGVANTNNVLGSLVLDGGALQTTGVLNSARGVVITSANGTVDTTSQTDTLSGSISGSGQLVKTGSGVLKLTGTNNTFQGGVKVKEGTLEVSTNEALGSVDGKIEIDGATLAITGSTVANTSNTLNRSVSLTSNGGTLSVATGDATLSGTIKADIGLKPALIKSGAGNLNLTGANSLFEGDIFVKEGSLGISEQGNLGKGQLKLDGGNIRISNDLLLEQKIVIDSHGGGIDTNNHTASVSGVMSGAGTLVKMGLGTLELKSPNTYSGGTLIKQGVLAIDDSNNLGALGKTITLNGGDLQIAKDIDFGTLSDGGRTIVVDVGGGGIDTNGHDSKIGTVLSGSGVFVKKGEGNLTLNQVGSNLLTAGITVKQGSLSVGSDGSLGTSHAILTLDGGELRSTATLESSRNIQLASHGTLNTQGNILTLNGVVGGVGSLSLTKEKDGPVGHLVLNGDNTYTGGTTIDAGEVTVSKNKSFGTGGVVLADKTTLKTSAAVTLSNQLQLTGTATIDSAKDNDSVLTGVISGVGGLNKDGIGSLTLNGVNTYTGNTVINAGKVIVNNNQSLGLANTVALKVGVALETSAAVTLSNQLRLDGDATVSVKANNSILNGVVSGTGGLSKDGTGSLALNGVNTYTGNTVINAGKVIVNNSQAFGGGTDITLKADTVLETSAAVALSKKILLVSGNATVNTIANDSSLSGDISGDGGLTKEGVGQLILSGTNTYKGNTNINAGMLGISQDSNLGDVSNSLILNGGALQTLADLTISRDLTISASQGGIDTAGHNTVITGLISGGTDASQLIKSGAGSLTLTNENNSYVGTTVTGGALIVEKDNQLGKTGNVLLNGGALEITANIVSSRSIQLGNNNGTLNTQNNALSLSGLINGSGGLIKLGAGSVTLSGDNTYSGNTQINAGTVIAGKASAFGVGNVTFADKTGLETSSALNLSNNIELLGATTLQSKTNDKDSTLSGVVSGSGSFIKEGTGSLSLTGSNTYSGGTLVNAGKVIANNATSLGAGKASFADKTTLETTAVVTLANNVELLAGNVAISSLQNSTLGGVISGAGALNKEGAGSLTLTGVNTYSGGTQLNVGRIIINQNGSLGTGKVTLAKDTTLETASAVNLDNQLQLSGNATFQSLNSNSSVNGIVSGSGRLTKDGSGTLTLSGLNTYTGGTTVSAGAIAASQDENLGASSSVLTLNGGRLQALSSNEYQRSMVVGISDGAIDTQANTVKASGVISGVGKLTKLGAGTLILSGANSYTGGTIVGAGTLAISNQGNVGAGSLSIQNATLRTDADLQLDRTLSVTDGATIDTAGHAVTVAGVVNGSGSLIKSGAGSLELSGTHNTYSGGTVLKAGTLTVSSDSNLGTGNLQVEGGTLSLKDGFISSKTLTQNSTNDILITGNGAFGNTIVNSGALVVNGTLSSPITIGVGGTLRGSGKVIGNTTVQGTLSPGNSPGILTITGNLTQASTATLLVDIDGATAGTGAGKYDQVIVSNTFKADGNLVAQLRGITGAATNTFTPSIGQAFEVVKANAVQGVFASYTAPTTATGLAAGTRLDVGYTPTAVVLYVTPESYSAVVSGDNRSGVARFLDNTLKIARATPNSLVGTSDLAKLYQALIPANTQMINDALVSMSPAIYAESAQSILAIQQSLHNTQTLSESFKKGGVAVKLLQQDTDIDSDGNGIAATRSISGAQLAIDSEPYNNGWQMGATISVINKGDITGQGAALDLSGQDITLALRKQSKEWMFGAELDAGSYQFDSQRHIALGNTVFTTAQEGIKATTYGLGLNASRAFATNWSLTTGLRYNNMNQKSFMETGNSLLKLSVDKVQQNQVVGMIGANWSQEMASANWKITPKAGLQLEQLLKGDTAQVDAMLSSQRVSSQASDAGKSLLRGMVGVSFANHDGLTIGVDAASEQGSNTSGTTGRLSLSKSF